MAAELEAAFGPLDAGEPVDAVRLHGLLRNGNGGARCSGACWPSGTLMAQDAACARSSWRPTRSSRPTWWRAGGAVNIDPGYLLLERFVLATGKNYSHRIYIGAGHLRRPDAGLSSAVPFGRCPGPTRTTPTSRCASFCSVASTPATSTGVGVVRA
ncbi:MAG: DUF4416 family protein [Desulfobacterales bacterium]|nr:DUF4416 family protein [Desulfobacterales bacterium]